MSSRQWLVLKRTVDPTDEPVSIEEAKDHLRVDISADDAYIAGLVQAAREYVEDVTRRAFLTQTWRLSLPDWPEGEEIELPRPPLQSVSSLVYIDSDGTSNTVSTSLYHVDTDQEPGRIMLAYGESWPSATLRTLNPVQVTYVAGYGDEETAIPQQFKHLILLLVGHWYEHREPVIMGQVPREVPMAVDSLIWANRVEV